MINGSPTDGIGRISANAAAFADLTGPRVVRPRVLSLDDELEILALMRIVLEKAGYEFWGTDDEAEATCLLCFSKRVDVFTQDLDRPAGVGGCQILHWLRSHPKLRRIPVLIVSGYPEPWARQMLENAGLHAEAGRVGFLQKPFTSEQLSRSVRRMLVRRGGGPGFTGQTSDEALAS
jgi:CheY-like chemotaxis protein